MNEAILVKQVHLPIANHQIKLSEVEIPSLEGQTVCGTLYIVTKAPSFLKIRAKENNKKFKLVFFRKSRVMAVSVAYTTVSGDEYQVTAQKGYGIGILCVI